MESRIRNEKVGKDIIRSGKKGKGWLRKYKVA